MAGFGVAHRITVFSGISNSVALFQVSSLAGAASPYLSPPELTPRRIEVPECRADPGQLRFRVLDPRATPGDQQARVFTALLGDSQGRLALRASRVEYDVSDDGGATYQREFTGRVNSVDLADKNTLAFTVDDPQVDVLNEIFDGTYPAVDWAMPPVLFPVGRLSPDGLKRYGPYSAVAPPRGIIRSIGGGLGGTYIENTRTGAQQGETWRRFWSPSQIITDALEEAAAYTEAPGPLWTTRLAPDLRVAFRPTGSSTYLHFSVGVVYAPFGIDLGGAINRSFVISGDGAEQPMLSAVGIASADGDDVIPAVGTEGEFFVYLSAPPKPAVPMLVGHTPGPDAPQATISGVHWAVMVSGIAHGAFGGRGFAIDYPRFNALIQDATQPKFRFRIMEGPVDALTWMDENVWPVVGYAPAVTASGTMYPVSYDPPAALPALVFNAANTITARWAQNATEGQINNVRIETMREREIPPPIVERDSPADMLREFDGDRIIVVRDPGAGKQKTFEIRARGIRATADSDELVRERQYMLARADSILDRFQDGPQTVELVAARSAATKGAIVGDHALVSVPWLPDLETKRRGGTRVMLITSKGVNGDGTYTFEMLDNGPDQFVDAPTLDGVVLELADPRHSVQATLTPPGAPDRAVLDVATTLSGVAAPAEGSEAWMHVVSVSGTGQQTITIPNLASRRRHHFRTIGRGAGRMPSAYSSVLSVHTAAITPPTAVVATTSGRAVLMEWANGDPSYAVMPLIAYGTGTPVSGFLTRALPPGSTRFVFTELFPAGDARVGVKHVDDFGGDSTVAHVAATVGSPTTLAAPVGLTVLQGRSENDPGSPRDISLGIGVELQWSVSEPYANTVVHYASEGAFLAPVAISGIAIDRARVLLPLTNTTWYFRAFHQRDQFTTSAATETVSAKPVPLQVGSNLNDGFAGGYAYLSADRTMAISLNVGSADPDAERFFYVVSASAFTEPTTASPSVLRSQFPYSAAIGMQLETDAYLWGKFWHPTKGFGQGVKHKLSAPVPVDSAPDLDEDDGAFYLYPRRSVSSGSVIYTVTTDGSEPADPKGSDDAGGPVGTVSTASEILVATAVVDGTRVRVKVKAAQAAGGTGTKGAIHQLRGTYHAADDRPEVTRRLAVPAGTNPAGKEAFEFTVTDDSNLVAFWLREYAEGAAPAAWAAATHRFTDATGTPAPTGYAADPLRVPWEVTRPAEGGTRRVVEYFAEDGAGNVSGGTLAVPVPHTVYVDGDLIPSGQIKLIRDDATGEVRILVTSDDGDTGSYRLLCDVDPAGSNGYDDPAFDGGSAAEYSGAWGATGQSSGEEFGQHFTPTQQPGPGEELFVSCFFLRSTSTVAATQEVSTRSAPVRASVPYNADHRPTVKWDWVRSGTTGTLTATIADPFAAITALEYNSREGAGSASGWTAWTGGTGSIPGTSFVRSRALSVPQGKDSEIQARITWDDAGGVSRVIEESFTSTNWDKPSRTIQIPILDFRDAEAHGVALEDAADGTPSYYVRANATPGAALLYSMRFLQPVGQILKSFTLDMYNTSGDNGISFSWWRINADGSGAAIYSSLNHSGATGWETIGGSVVTEPVGTAAYKLIILFGSATSVDNQRLRNLVLTYERPTGQDSH